MYNQADNLFLKSKEITFLTVKDGNNNSGSQN